MRMYEANLTGGGDYLKMKYLFRGAIGFAVLGAAMLISPTKANAQNPPPGAILDLATTSEHTGVLSSYTLFTASFTADSSSTYVSFAFREIPAYFALDDTSVTAMGSSTNLLGDPGFETATVGQNVPTGWNRWIQPIDTSAIGVVAAGASSSCGPNAAHGGSQLWCDGSVQGYDAVYQAVATTAGQTYNVSWWLGDNSGTVPYNPGIDMLLYAGDSIPVGTVPIGGAPEPASIGLLMAGIGGLALASRKYRANR